MERALQREAIVELSLRYARALDDRDWAELRSCLDEEIDADFSDTIGMGPVAQPSALL